VLLASSILPSLHETFPQAQIVMLVNSGTQGILSHNPYLHEVLCVPHGNWWQQVRFLREIRARQFDWVLDFTDGDRSAIMSAATGASVRLGYNNEKRWRGHLYSSCVDSCYGTMHMVDYHGMALTKLGIGSKVSPPQVFTHQTEEEAADRLIQKLDLVGKPWVMIHPAARYWFKAWSVQRFAALADALQKQGFRVVCVGASSDTKVYDEIQNTAHNQVISLMGQTSVLELAALMKRASLFIGNDGGPMHIAAGVGCNIVALFGPSDPSVWGPCGGNHKVIYKGLDCRECFYPGCSRGEQSCMNQISVQEVLDAAMEFLRPQGPAR
jgi:predicted lipopolysaccharide heptosyltransferase III